MNNSSNKGGCCETTNSFLVPLQGAVLIIILVCAGLSLMLNSEKALITILGLSLTHFKIWQPLTATFCHFELWHLLFNCLAIWMFGSQLESLWKTKKFALFFITTATVANVIWIIYVWLFNEPTTLLISIGASGGVYAILYAYAYFWPDNPIWFFGFFAIKAKIFICIIAFIDIFNVISSQYSTSNHVVHLSGLAIAAIWIDLTCNGRMTLWIRKKYDFLIFKKKTSHLTLIKGKLGKDDPVN